MNAALGETLRLARLARKLSLEEAARATHIRPHYLQAMEAGDFESLPSIVQAKGFLRAYAGFLGLEAESLLPSLEGQPLEILAEPGQAAKAESPARDSVSGFREAGQRLQAQRELLGLSLEDIERHTHLRVHYLRAIEAGNLEGLPSPVQGRGMLSNYADFLGLDPDPLLLLFAEELQSRLSTRRPEVASATRRVSAEPARRGRRLLNRDVLLSGMVILALVAFAVWGGLQLLSNQPAETAQPTPPSIADVLLPSATQGSTPTPSATSAPLLDVPNQDNGVEQELAQAQPTAVTTQVVLLPQNASGPVQAQIVVRQRAYMRILVDGEVAFDGRVFTGSAYLFAGDESIEILTGSGSALQVIYNDQDLGTLGDYGQVVDFVITVDGVQTPTPTITFTPTLEPTPTVTPTPP
jgi:cytoskeletal protein RodZ